MKIHIVQKGDTLWELSKKYGVNFEELKQINSHLASPDMIMPGMKIKIPSSSKTVIKETPKVKEAPKETVKHPYKETSPKAKPVIHEDDNKEHAVVKPQMPVQPVPQMPQMPLQPIMQMPIMEQDVNNYTTINFPQMPVHHHPKEQKKKEHVKEKPVAKPAPKPVQKPVQKPAQKPAPKPVSKPKETFVQPAAEQPVPIPMPVPMPVPMPIYYQPMEQPCFVPFFDPCMPCPPMVPDNCMHHHPMHHSMHNPMHYPMHHHMFPAMQMMPQDDCGCGSSIPMRPYAVEQQTHQEPMPNQGFHQQPVLNTQQMFPAQFGAQPDANFAYPVPPSFPESMAMRDEEDEE